MYMTRARTIHGYDGQGPELERKYLRCREPAIALANPHHDDQNHRNRNAATEPKQPVLRVVLLSFALRAHRRKCQRGCTDTKQGVAGEMWI